MIVKKKRNILSTKKNTSIANKNRKKYIRAKIYLTTNFKNKIGKKKMCVNKCFIKKNKSFHFTDSISTKGSFIFVEYSSSSSSTGNLASSSISD